MWNGILTSTRGRDGRRSTCKVDASMLDCEKNRSILEKSTAGRPSWRKGELFFQFEIPRIISDILNSGVRATWYPVVRLHSTSALLVHKPVVVAPQWNYK